MTFGERVKEAVASRAAEGLAVSASLIVIWAASKISPLLVPAIASGLAREHIVSILLASLGLNLVLVALFWAFNRKPPLRLKYGIYWDSDKNPHCPNCKIPIAGYGNYESGGRGYYCKPCKKIFPLQDSSGNDVDPAAVVGEL